MLGGKEGWQIVTTAQISSAAATKNTPEPDMVRWIVGVCMVYAYFVFLVLAELYNIYLLIKLVIHLKCRFKTRIYL